MARPNPAKSQSRLLGALVVLALLPWGWALLFIPPWVSGVALVVALIAVFVAWKLLAAPAAPSMKARGAGAPTPDATQDAQGARRASRPLRRLLARWAGITQTTSTDLSATQDTLQEVIDQSESAVLNIGKSFRNITSRSTRQIEYAKGLLQETIGPGDVGSGDSNELEMSLPEYIRAYEVLLNLAIDRLSDFANECVQLTDAANAAKVGNDDPGSWSERLRKLAQESRHDAEQAKADAAHLSGGMALKNQQVTDVLKHINNTAVEIKKDVNQLVIAMQFQDITQQRLERIRGPLLDDIVRSLTSISDEARVLSKQLKTGVIRVPGADGMQPAHTPAAQPGAIDAPVVHTPASTRPGAVPPKPATDRGDENQVELF
jgi:methyl-accepting chemotaxis protein